MELDLDTKGMTAAQLAKMFAKMDPKAKVKNKGRLILVVPSESSAGDRS